MADDEKPCKHIRLTLLGGALHPSGKDYVCSNCGNQFVVEPLVIGVGFGKHRESAT